MSICVVFIDKKPTKKCTVFPFHPWDPEENKRPGIVLWVPLTIEELIKESSEQLQVSGECCILSEDGGKILDVHMLDESQKLYLVPETH